MSILIAPNVNGILSLAGALDGTAKPITFCFFSKVNSFSNTSTSTVSGIKSSGGTGLLDARIVQNTTIRNYSASAFNSTYISAAVDLAANAAGQWRGIVAVFTSTTLRDVYTRINNDAGGLLTAQNTTSKVTSGETGLDLLSGLWPTSAARYSHLTVYDQALTSAQANEFLLSGVVAGVTPLHKWDAVSNWGAGTIANTGSSALALTPPVTWTYDADNPVFEDLENAPPVVSRSQLNALEYQISVSGAGGALNYSVIVPPSNGAATVNSSGLVTYTPGGSFTGSDSFVVSVSDGIETIYNTITISDSAGLEISERALTARSLTAVGLTASSFTARGL